MTVSTMLLMGVKPENAFRLSYLAYIPASLGAFAATFFVSRDQINSAIQSVEPSGVLVAIIVALVTGLFVISYLLKFAKQRSIYKVDLVLGLIAVAIGIITAFFGLPTSAA